MPRVRLLKDAPEGGPGNVVMVSRSRAQDLVNAGIAQRPMEQPDPGPVKRARKKEAS